MMPKKHANLECSGCIDVTQKKARKHSKKTVPTQRPVRFSASRLADKEIEKEVDD